MSIVGQKFPDLKVNAMNEMGDTFKINIFEKKQKKKIKKSSYFGTQKTLLMYVQLNYTLFQEAMSEFDKRNTIVIGASCDTPEVHFAWLNTPKDDGGIEGVTYPILADSNRNLSSRLGILDTTNERYDEETGYITVDGDNVTYRATYLIDEEGTVFHEGVNHMPLGRNVSEFIRMIDAYAHVQKHGEVCPANGKKVKRQ